MGRVLQPPRSYVAGPLGAGFLAAVWRPDLIVLAVSPLPPPLLSVVSALTTFELCSCLPSAVTAEVELSRVLSSLSEPAQPAPPTTKITSQQNTGQENPLLGFASPTL